MADTIGAVIAIVVFVAAAILLYYVVSRLMDRSAQRRASRHKDEDS